MKYLMPLFFTFALSGCVKGVRELAPTTEEKVAEWLLSPETILLASASAAAAIGALLFFVGIVFLWLGWRKRAFTALGLSACLVVGAPIMWWVGTNLWWIALSVGVLTATACVWYLWSNIEHYERKYGVDVPGVGLTRDQIKTSPTEVEDERSETVRALEESEVANEHHEEHA